MGILKTRKNKKFGYEPRYFKGEGSPYEMKGRFDEYRSTLGSNGGLKGRFSKAINEFKEGEQRVNKTIAFIVLILIFLFLWMIDFDLSIFTLESGAYIDG